MRVSVTGPDGTRSVIHLPEHDHIAKVMQNSGAFYEADLLLAIKAEGRGGVYMDIGAHCGNHAVFFAQHCPSTMVLAVEPSPDTFDLLRATARENDPLRIFTTHGGVHPSWGWLRSTESAWRPPASDPKRVNTGTRGIVRGVAGDTPAWTLDRLGLPFRAVGVVKIDTEGLGAEVLQSGLTLLKRDKPLIAVEAATAPEQGRVQEVLGSVGYERVGCFCRTPTWIWRHQCS
jgi:FkbM family methyltransferase